MIEQLASRKRVILDLLVLACLAVIPFLLHGTYIVHNSMLDLCVDPVYLLQRELFLWNSKELAGTVTGWGTSYLFPVTSFFAFFSLFSLSGAIIERMWFAFIYFLSGAAMFYLTSVLTPQKYRIARTVAGIAYMYNLYIFITTQGASVLLLPYATLPLMLGLYIRGLSAKNYIKYAIFLGFTSTVMSFVSPPLVILNGIVLILYLLFHTTQKPRNLKRIIKFNVVSLLFCVLLNMWIILPIIGYTLSTYGIQAPIIFSEDISWIHSQSSFSETFRLLGVWYFYGTGAPGVLNFSYSPLFRSNPLYILTSFLVPILSALALLMKPKNRYTIFFGILLVIFIPLAVATYPPQNPSPTGKIYLWMYRNIPFFNILLKDNYKFVTVLSFSYSFFLGILANESYLNLGKSRQSTKFICFKRIAKKIPTFLIIGIILINAFPIVTGNIFYEKMKIYAIPDYWYESADWINEQKDDFRILLLPKQYFPLYTWGHAGEPSLSLYKKSIICTYPAAISPSLNLINQIYDQIHQNSTLDIGNLRKLNVKYILQRDDFEWELSPDKHSPEYIKSVLNSQKGIHFEKTFGQLHFYRVDDFAPRHIWVDAGDIMLRFNVANNQANEFLYNYSIKSNASASFMVPVDGAWRLLIKQSNFVKLNNNLESIVLDIDGKSTRLSYQAVNETDSWISFNQINLTQGNHTINIGVDLIPLTLANFEDSENWEKIMGDISLDKINFKEGGQGLVLYQGFGYASIADRKITLDLATGSSSSDHIDFWVHVDNVTNLNKIGILFETSPELSEYYVHWVTKGLSDGWNYISIPKSNFIDNTGHANWAKVSTIKMMAYANSNGMVKVTFDDLRLVMISSGLDAIISAEGIIPPEISYTRLNPTKYIAHITNATTPYLLTFSESYDPQWHAFINEKGQTGWLESFFQEPVNKHFLGYDYANSWYINKTGTYDITLEYLPQKLFDLGLMFSLATIVLDVLYLLRAPIRKVVLELVRRIRNWRKHRNRRNSMSVQQQKATRSHLKL